MAKNKDNLFIFRLDHITSQKLDELAKYMGLSKGATIRLLIVQRYKQDLEK